MFFKTNKHTKGKEMATQTLKRGLDIAITLIGNIF